MLRYREGTLSVTSIGTHGLSPAKGFSTLVRWWWLTMTRIERGSVR